MNILKILISSCLLLATQPLLAAMQKIEHADGTIEYTNVSGGRENTYNVSGSSNSTRYIYKSSGENITTYSNRKPTDGSTVEVFTFRVSCFACSPHSKINWHTVRLQPNAYADTIKEASEKYGVSAALIRAVIHAESAFNPSASSRVGAQGLMQLMPATARGLGVSNSLDPVQNIHGGAKYLGQMLAKFNNNLTKATAAYNAGPGAVSKYGGVPPYKETQVYVKRVAILQARYAKL